MRSKNFSVRISADLRAKLEERSVAQTSSSRIRECIDNVDQLIETSLIDTTPAWGDLLQMTVRLSEKHRAIVNETAKRVGLSPHQLIIRIIQYLAR